MTEATYTAADYEAAMAENSLTIPWFLNAKNPDNIKRRADRAEAHAIKPSTKSPPKRVAKPAKSVATMPKAEQVVTKPEKVIDVPAPAPKPTTTKKGKLNGDAIIRVLVTEFGHKAGSKAEAKSAAMEDGMTVAEYMAIDLGYAGKWHSSHLSHCIGKNFIRLEESK